MDKGWRARVGSAKSHVAHAAADVGVTTKNLAERVGARPASGDSGSDQRSISALVDAVLSVPVPATLSPQPWKLGLADVVGAQGVPPAASRLLGLLDRFGSLALSDTHVGIDGQGVSWNSLQEVSLSPVRELLTGQAMQREVDRLTALLPRVPGRRWVVRQVADTLAAIAWVAARLDERGGDTLSRAVPAVLTAKGLVRSSSITPGFFAVLVMAVRPDIADLLVRTARARGISVTSAPPSRVTERAATLAAFATSVQARFGRVAADADEVPASTGDDGQPLSC